MTARSNGTSVFPFNEYKSHRFAGTFHPGSIAIHVLILAGYTQVVRGVSLQGCDGRPALGGLAPVAGLLAERRR